MDNKQAFARFEQTKEKMVGGGGEQALEKQRQRGKQTARERIAALADDGSFVETQSYSTSRSSDFGMDKKHFDGDGVVTGSVKVDGRQVCVSSQDFSVLGGSLGEMHAGKIAESQEISLQNGVPFIQINDSGGARIQEGVTSLDGYAKIFRNNTFASGVVPQFSVILGPCAGGAVYSPAITDFIFMVDGMSHMYITGPEVIKAVTGEVISHEDLGGAAAHAGKSGNAHFRFADEAGCFAFIRRLLSYLPANNREMPPLSVCDDPPDRAAPSLRDILPENPRAPYDVRDIITQSIDTDSFLEVHRDFAQSVVVGFGKLNGRTVGIFANQPKHMAAVLDIDSSDKGARFIRFCDSFNIPIISFVDVPGYLPGVAQEHGGIIRHGAKLLYAIAEATVPKISCILRKSYGGSMIVMSAKALGWDRVIAYPTAEIAVMGAEGAANIIFRREIGAAEDQEAKRQEMIGLYKDKFMSPFVAARLGFIDEVIDPAYTRSELIKSLEVHLRKKVERPLKKHGNIPL